eukprot:XP_003729264.2 PREDICTED: uncharacterized protein LOC100892286 [Strongylocentrotus purpuratus]
MTSTSRMSTVPMETTLSAESVVYTPMTEKTTAAGGAANDHGKNNSHSDPTAISVAASAASLILVLVAIVIWYFLVRKQLLSKTKSHQRLGSHKSHRSNQGSRQSSFQDGHHDNVSSHKNHHGSKHSPKSHRSSNSPKSHHRHSGCHDNKEVCTCRKSYDSPLAIRRSPKGNTVTECTGNSPYCPHTTRFQHPNHRKGTRDSVHSELSDAGCTAPVEAICTCDLPQGHTKVITGADFTVVELEAHNKRHMPPGEPIHNGHLPCTEMKDIPSTSATPHQPESGPQCTCPHPHPPPPLPVAPVPDSPHIGASHRKVANAKSDPGVIGQKGNGEMV